ncbi:DUF3306 domain-containing protein [Shimia sp. R11_0]|uniref:DUF3306 domain-containing protein n=1 Tax=Shimia sp. R11_0 TaxID=2821096 RepID=UPI001ADC1DEB|nr:DUF3306 domain-containing protein [Shimia sp. R11_0]MBO9476365.1 DUF3306 domain-containing protein [Shimia sp. R11_0]
MSRGGDFWARRKAAVAAEAEADTRAEAAATLEAQHAALEEKSDAEILEELALPDPDTLAQGDDFSVFLAKAVPERIRRRALRKLWLSNPVLANVDELVDYGEDFTDSAMVVEGMQTAYQIGKGMLKHVEEMARQAEEKAQSEENLPESDVSEDEDAPLEAVAEVEFEATPTPVFSVAAPTDNFETSKDETPDPQESAPVRRRLRFTFAAAETTEERAQP